MGWIRKKFKSSSCQSWRRLQMLSYSPFSNERLLHLVLLFCLWSGVETQRYRRSPFSLWLLPQQASASRFLRLFSMEAHLEIVAFSLQGDMEESAQQGLGRELRVLGFCCQWQHIGSMHPPLSQQLGDMHAESRISGWWRQITDTLSEGLYKRPVIFLPQVKSIQTHERLFSKGVPFFLLFSPYMSAFGGISMRVFSRGHNPNPRAHIP